MENETLKFTGKLLVKADLGLRHPILGSLLTQAPVSNTNDDPPEAQSFMEEPVDEFSSRGKLVSAVVWPPL